MALIWDTDALPTIASTWTAPTSCFASTLYYRVFYKGNFFSNLYGTPTPVFEGNTPTGACVPPSFTMNVPFRTDGGCPTGYTTACTGTGTSRLGTQLTTVTCCPSVTGGDFSFMCKDHQYGCHATATVGAVWTGAITNLENSNFESVTRTPSTNEGLEAWGIRLISIASSTATTTSPTASATTTPVTTAPVTATPATTALASQTPATTSATSGDNNPTDGISTGAIAGIAIGAAAVIGIALAAVLIYRIRRNRGATYSNHDSHEATGEEGMAYLPNKHHDIYAYPNGTLDGRVHEAAVQIDNGGVHEAPTHLGRTQPWELQ
ncbi:uncharacterized protein PgNI_08022 [Pyricularia grisea]|uniref:Mid2 domain-containing protein n=1 Tax=Pyricularia grisea TaxID=148305 RepID=A0A6P8AWL8_PYRGI|nr:uncharacterized protein PgNI_08022 [Pyricularia grisea]TLD06569.1 hypothetical protein PgNI_08022 [Pyricularia grisea]